MTPEPFRLTLRRDIARKSAPAVTTLVSPLFQLALPELSNTLNTALDLLSGAGATMDQLAEMARSAGGELERIRLESMLEAIDRSAMLCRSVGSDGGPWATLIPCTPAFSFSPQLVSPGVRYRLSRFAVFRRVENEMVLESPLSACRIVVSNWRAAAAIALLGNDVSACELRDAIPSAQLEDVEALLSLMEAAGMAGRINVRGRIAEDEKPELITWEFQDLFFHSRSRSGRHDAGVGGTFRFRERTAFPPVSRPPVFKESMRGEKIPLYRPSFAEPASRELTLSQVLDMRRSRRRYGEQPVTAAQVGQFLFLSARVIETRRPYPSGGACYELECYLAVNSCADLEPGLYHYQPEAHDLIRLPAAEGDVHALLRDAWRAAAKEDEPQVLVILAARFGRVTVKYESMAYAVILKNTGVLMQTLHLAATSLGLAGCPIGCGNSDLFARATGLNYYEEGSVGEFLLGSLATD